MRWRTVIAWCRWTSRSASLGAGLLLGLVPYVLWRRLRPPAADAAPQVTEPIVFEAAVTHFTGEELRRGILSVTASEVVFVPDRYAVRRATLRLRLADVKGLQWYRWPVPAGYESTSSVLLATERTVEGFLFRSLDSAEGAAHAMAGPTTEAASLLREGR